MDAATAHTYGAVVDAAEPRVVLADDVPRLCGKVAGDRRLVTVASHPSSSRHHRIRAADR